MLLQSCGFPLRFATRYSSYPVSTIQRVFEDIIDRPSRSPTQTSDMSVRLDVRESDSSFVVIAELPGISTGDIDVSYDNGVLTIRGEKKPASSEAKDTWHIRERFHGSFTRQLALPTTIDANGVDARFEQGLLQIVLPKRSDAQTAARKIAIKSS